MLRHLACFSLLAIIASSAWAVDGADLAIKSTGEARGPAWTLSGGGYVGAYVRVDQPATVTLTLDLRNGPAEAVIAGRSAIYDDQRGPQSRTFDLPAGTHLVRVQPAGRPNLTILSLNVQDARLLNEHTDANALDAANTYIRNDRRGPATVTIEGVEPGAPVHVKLRRHAFNFGTNAPGWDNLFLKPNPEPGSDAARYQAFIVERFNMVAPSNAGKWAYNERQRDQVNMGAVEEILGFARKHGMRARMHALIWAARQEPAWVYPLLDAAAAGDGAAARELREEISERIDYYVADLVSEYAEVDVLNESLHQPRYLKAYGVKGVADIYRQAAEAADGRAGLYVNEYNVLQWSSRVDADGKGQESDPYANWYREHVEALREAGGPVTGVGIQYYADGRTTIGGNQHSPARILQTLQNLATTGLPLTLTEFEVRGTDDPKRAADVVEETFRLFFGMPEVTSALIWAITPTGDNPPVSVLVDKDWNLTPVGERFDALMDEWDTDERLTVDANGAVNFTGYYGDYDVTIGDQTYPLTLEKGRTRYTVDR